MSVVRTWEVPNRKAVVQFLAPKLRTGDIILRESYTEGPFGIPFSTLVSKLSQSEYSHASLVIMRGEKPYIFEVNDRGSIEYRLIDWLDFCQDGKFVVLRLRDLTPELESALGSKIEEYLERDEDYDFNYSHPNKLYCTESAMQVYNEVGIEIIKPVLLQEIIKGWKFWVFKIGNALVRKLTGKGFDLDYPIYFVGNQQHGILSSVRLWEVTSSAQFLKEQP